MAPSIHVERLAIRGLVVERALLDPTKASADQQNVYNFLSRKRQPERHLASFPATTPAAISTL
jgi:hypothetical protein